jgi:hypothetical protein
MCWVPPVALTRTWPLSAAMCICVALVVGMVSAINLAIPSLAAGDLHPTATELLWIVDGYVVVFACLLVPAGAVADRFGRKGGVVGAGAVIGAPCGHRREDGEAQSAADLAGGVDQAGDQTDGFGVDTGGGGDGQGDIAQTHPDRSASRAGRR